jgi:hypothetical protein
LDTQSLLIRNRNHSPKEFSGRWWVWALGHGHQQRIRVAHIMAANDVGTIGQAVGCLSLAERNNSAAELMAAHATTTMSAARVSNLPFRSTTTCRTLRPDVSVSSRFTGAICQHGHIRILQRRVNAQNLGIGVCMNQAGESVARVAANAGAQTRVLFVQHNAQGRVKGPQACRGEVVC